MSNIAGKAYAINLITPIRDAMVPLNKLLFWAAGRSLLRRSSSALSVVQFGRWLVLRERDFPKVSEEQPNERLRHGYLIFLGTINCNLQDCVEHFASTFPSVLSWLCFGTPSSPRRRTLQRNIARNQTWTDYFYSASPMASANDIRSAERVKRALCTFVQRTEDIAPAEFMQEYHALLKELQGDLSLLSAKGFVSMAARDQPAFVAPDAPSDTDVYRSAIQAAAEPRAISERVRRAQ